MIKATVKNWIFALLISFTSMVVQVASALTTTPAPAAIPAPASAAPTTTPAPASIPASAALAAPTTTPAPASAAPAAPTTAATIPAELTAVPEWKIIPNESSITFTGTQNGAPASGSFKKFTGEIRVDPKQPNASKIRIVIDMNSVSMSYSDFTATLGTPDWFNVKVFPQAVFEATKFIKINDVQYKTQGTLTIRDKTKPVTVVFTAEELPNNKVRVEGTATLKRSEFGVGQGEWADTNTVKDEVQVNFTIAAVKK